MAEFVKVQVPPKKIQIAGGVEGIAKGYEIVINLSHIKSFDFNHKDQTYYIYMGGKVGYNLSKNEGERILKMVGIEDFPST